MYDMTLLSGSCPGHLKVDSNKIPTKSLRVRVIVVRGFGFDSLESESLKYHYKLIFSQIGSFKIWLMNYPINIWYVWIWVHWSLDFVECPKSQLESCSRSHQWITVEANRKYLYYNLTLPDFCRLHPLLSQKYDIYHWRHLNLALSMFSPQYPWCVQWLALHWCSPDIYITAAAGHWPQLLLWPQSCPSPACCSSLAHRYVQFWSKYN